MKTLFKLLDQILAALLEDVAVQLSIKEKLDSLATSEQTNDFLIHQKLDKILNLFGDPSADEDQRTLNQETADLKAQNDRLDAAIVTQTQQQPVKGEN